MTKLNAMDQCRVVNLVGAYNVRDLGGYPTKDGKYTQWGKYYRADSLHQLSSESQEVLLRKGIGQIIDLRFPYEGSYLFHKELDIKYINIPLFNPAELKEEIPKSLLELYCNIINSNQKSIYQVMKQIIAEQGKAILFHCKIGKDRTGIIAALLLDLVGVPHNIIAQDYAVSAINLQPLLKESRKRLAAVYGTKSEALLESNPETMLGFLEHINKKYKNAEGYLKKIGIVEQEIELIKKNFVGEENGEN
jgi:protein-tyrosine phosphatase